MAQEAARILIVDDERDFCDILFHLLKQEGFIPTVAYSGESAIEMMRLGMPDVVLLDFKMEGVDGMEVLRMSKALNPYIPVIMISAFGGVEGAVRAVKEGAFDYLQKPVNNRELIKRINKALRIRHAQMKQVQSSGEEESATATELRAMLGPSDAVKRIVSEIALVAGSNFTVVIQGETGTGKEVVASAIHRFSSRSKGPFVPLDCGAIPESLFESEMFGYEKGAFTGASTSRAGKFEMAQEGTLFLDEIANMPLNSQVKLLRAIQEKSFYPVGGRKPVSVDVRLLAATNKDLGSAIVDGSFSGDLFYRLSEFTINIPPLRERTDDLLYLAERFVRATNVELGKSVKGFSESAISLLLSYSWPGNVRHLKSVIRRAVLQADDYIGPGHLHLEPARAQDPQASVNAPNGEWAGLSLREVVRRCTSQVEKQVITHTLRKTKGNKAKAARLLQVDYKTIHSKIKEFDIRIDKESDDGQEG
jgi:two-component system nitrogen regulation response regulator GlnG